MTEERLDALLGRMKDIAEAVNAFSSEAVQQAAFDALVSAFHGRGHTTKLAEDRPYESAGPASDLNGGANDDAPEKTGNRKPAKRKAGTRIASLVSYF